MTKPKIANICDFCAKDITSEMEYSLQINQKGKKGSKGKFVKADNKADMCQPCFLDICKNGYKADWTTLKKNAESGKWEILDEQEKIDE